MIVTEVQQNVANANRAVDPLFDEENEHQFVWNMHHMQPFLRLS